MRRKKSALPFWLAIFLALSILLLTNLHILVSIRVERTGVEIPAYAYRTPIIINYSYGKFPLENYTIKITLDTASLIKEGKINPSCSDIVFTNSSSWDPREWKVRYKYWVYNCNSNETEILIEIDKIPAGSTKPIYMYYGIHGVVEK